MRRLLRLPVDAPVASEASACKLVETSLAVSTVRCLLTYVFLPFVAPILGLAAGVAPAVGVVVGLVAIVANVASVRRFWRADHRYRWAYTALASVIVVLLVWLVVADLVELLG
jgi:multisubunit Na+/H+ antiporter MnhB subunit